MWRIESYTVEAGCKITNSFSIGLVSIYSYYSWQLTINVFNLFRHCCELPPAPIVSLANELVVIYRVDADNKPSSGFTGQYKIGSDNGLSHNCLLSL